MLVKNKTWKSKDLIFILVMTHQTGPLTRVKTYLVQLQEENTTAKENMQRILFSYFSSVC